MESINISFTVTGQDLMGDCPFLCASNTVSYIIAEFDLDDNWKEFDSVRAIWRTDSECISTVLDNNGNCNVPQEVLKRKNEVIVNLVGSVVEDNELTERLTTYPVVALIVDATALICGTETADVTPSQFEQYIAQVIAEVEKVTGMTAVAVPLPEGSDPTASYEDGVLTLGIPKGEKGDTGNGIERVEFNSDYSLTFYFTEGDPYTTPSIRGERGAQGYGIVSVEKIGSVGLVDTYQVNYENPEIEPTTFTVTNGAKGDTGNGIESAVLNDDYTLTLTFTDGTEYTTPSIRGEQGEPGEVTLAQFASAFPTDTASGAIASFEDGSDLFDYLSCVVEINPVQAGSGTPSPDNVRPITGWTGCEVSQAGVNLFDKSNYNVLSAYMASGVITSGGSTRTLTWVKCKPNTTYTVSRIAVATNERISLAWSDYVPVIGGTVQDQTDVSISTTVGSLISRTLTTGATAKYLVCWVGWTDRDSEVSTFQIEESTTPTTYTPYNGTTYPVSWQTEAGTVYGGTVDLVTGVLTVDRASVDMGTLTPYQKESGVYGLHISCPTSGAILCSAYPVGIGSGGSLNPSNIEDKTIITTNFVGTYYPVFVKDTDYTSAADFKTAMNGVQLVYELATPITYQLDPVQVACLLGHNNVWADCGSIEEVKYKADVQLWVEKKLNA